MMKRKSTVPASAAKAKALKSSIQDGNTKITQAFLDRVSNSYTERHLEHLRKQLTATTVQLRQIGQAKAHTAYFPPPTKPVSTLGCPENTCLDHSGLQGTTNNFANNNNNNSIKTPNAEPRVPPPKQRQRKRQNTKLRALAGTLGERSCATKESRQEETKKLAVITKRKRNGTSETAGDVYEDAVASTCDSNQTVPEKRRRNRKRTVRPTSLSKQSTNKQTPIKVSLSLTDDVKQIVNVYRQRARLELLPLAPAKFCAPGVILPPCLENQSAAPCKPAKKKRKVPVQVTEISELCQVDSVSLLTQSSMASVMGKSMPNIDSMPSTLPTSVTRQRRPQSLACSPKSSNNISVFQPRRHRSSVMLSASSPEPVLQSTHTNVSVPETRCPSLSRKSSASPATCPESDCPIVVADILVDSPGKPRLPEILLATSSKPVPATTVSEMSTSRPRRSSRKSLTTSAETVGQMPVSDISTTQPTRPRSPEPTSDTNPETVGQVAMPNISVRRPGRPRFKRKHCANCPDPVFPMATTDITNTQSETPHASGKLSLTSPVPTSNKQTKGSRSSSGKPVLTSCKTASTLVIPKLTGEEANIGDSYVQMTKCGAKRAPLKCASSRIEQVPKSPALLQSPLQEKAPAIDCEVALPLTPKTLQMPCSINISIIDMPYLCKKMAPTRCEQGLPTSTGADVVLSSCNSAPTATHTITNDTINSVTPSSSNDHPVLRDTTGTRLDILATMATQKYDKIASTTLNSVSKSEHRTEITVKLHSHTLNEQVATRHEPDSLISGCECVNEHCISVNASDTNQLNLTSLCEPIENGSRFAALVTSSCGNLQVAKTVLSESPVTIQPLQNVSLSHEDVATSATSAQGVTCLEKQISVCSADHNYSELAPNRSAWLNLGTDSGASLQRRSRVPSNDSGSSTELRGSWKDSSYVRRSLEEQRHGLNPSRINPEKSRSPSIPANPSPNINVHSEANVLLNADIRASSFDDGLHNAVDVSCMEHEISTSVMDINGGVSTSSMSNFNADSQMENPQDIPFMATIEQIDNINSPAEISRDCSSLLDSSSSSSESESSSDTLPSPTSSRSSAYGSVFEPNGIDGIASCDDAQPVAEPCVAEKPYDAVSNVPCHAGPHSPPPVSSIWEAAKNAQDLDSSEGSSFVSFCCTTGLFDLAMDDDKDLAIPINATRSATVGSMAFVPLQEPSCELDTITDRPRHESAAPSQVARPNMTVGCQETLQTSCSTVPATKDTLPRLDTDENEWVWLQNECCVDYLRFQSCEAKECLLKHEYPNLDGIAQEKVVSLLEYLQDMMYDACYESILHTVALDLYNSPSTFNGPLWKVVVQEMSDKGCALQIVFNMTLKMCREGFVDSNFLDLLFGLMITDGQVDKRWSLLARVDLRGYKYPFRLADILMVNVLQLSRASSRRLNSLKILFEDIVDFVLTKVGLPDTSAQLDPTTLEDFLAMLSQNFPHLHTKLQALVKPIISRPNALSLSNTVTHPNQHDTPSSLLERFNETFSPSTKTPPTIQRLVSPPGSNPQVQKELPSSSKIQPLLSVVVRPEIIQQHKKIQLPSVDPVRRDVGPPDLRQKLKMLSVSKQQGPQSLPVNDKAEHQSYRSAVPVIAEEQATHAVQRVMLNRGRRVRVIEGESGMVLNRREKSTPRYDEEERERIHSECLEQPQVPPEPAQQQVSRVLNNSRASDPPTCDVGAREEHFSVSRETAEVRPEDVSQRYFNNCFVDSDFKRLLDHVLQGSVVNMRVLGDIVTTLYNHSRSPQYLDYTRALYLALRYQLYHCSKVFKELVYLAIKGTSGFKCFGPRMKEMLSAIGVNLLIYLVGGPSDPNNSAANIVSIFETNSSKLDLWTPQRFGPNENVSHAEVLFTVSSLHMKAGYPQKSYALLKDHLLFKPYSKDWKVCFGKGDEFRRNCLCEALLVALVQNNRLQEAYDMSMTIYEETNVPDSSAIVSPFVSPNDLFSQELLVQLINRNMAKEAYDIYNMRVYYNMPYISAALRGLFVLLSRPHLNMLPQAELVFGASLLNRFYPHGVMTNGFTPQCLSISSDWHANEISMMIQKFLKDIAKQYLSHPSFFVPDGHKNMIIHVEAKTSELSDLGLKELSKIPCDYNDVVIRIKQCLRQLSPPITVSLRSSGVDNKYNMKLDPTTLGDHLMEINRRG